jgi:hypothetical protein
VPMKSVAKLSTMTATTIATPANQSALQKGPDLEKEDFATCQPYPFLQLPVEDNPCQQQSPYHLIGAEADISRCCSFRQATYSNNRLLF